MKKVKKSLLLVFSLVLLSLSIVGCGNKEKATPEESVKILYDFALKGEKSGPEKLGMTDQQMNDVFEAQKKKIVDQARKNFQTAGLLVSEDDLNNIYTARCEALKKLSVTSEVVKKEDKKVTLKINTTYFKETDLDNKAAEDAVSTVKNLKLTDQNKIKDNLKKEYISNLIKSYTNLTVSTDTKSKEFNLVLKDGFWQAENPSDFGLALSKMSIGLE